MSFSHKQLHGGSVVQKGLWGGWSVQVAMWWVAYEILVSAQGPMVLGFGVWGLRVLGPGLDKRYQEYTLS